MNWTAVRLAFGTAVCLGLARFSFGLLVPAMGEDLNWSHADAGWITTVNSLGYLLGAIAATTVAARLGTTRTFRVGMLLCTVTLLAGAAAPLLIPARLATGFASALVFVTGGVLASRRGGIVVYFAGTGAAIALSGATLPPLLAGHAERWPLAWLGLAAAGAVATAVSWTAARGGDEPGTDRAAPARIGPLWRVATAYTLFGAGYLSYLTFLSVYLVEHEAPVWLDALTWSLLGVGVLVGAALWRTPALTTRLVVLAAAAALTLLLPAAPVVVAAAFAYGATMMGVPSGVTALVRDTVEPARWTASLSAFTVLFAAGQTAGPWAAGAVADLLRATSATLLWTVALCAVAAVLTVRQSPARL